MNPREYDFIAGIGEDCACSIYLRDHGLQVESLPFDWLTAASFDTRFELILNDFRGFLDEEDLAFLPKNPSMFNDEDCDYYQNTRNGVSFFHEFAKDEPLSKTLPAVQGKYRRRIERFYHQIEVSRRVLLVWLSHSKVADDAAALASQEKISAHFGKSVDLLIIEHRDGMNLGEVVTTDVSPHVRKQQLDTATWSQSQNETLGNVENVNPLFEAYRLFEPASTRMARALVRPIVRVVQPILPVRRWRKALKKKYRL